MKKTTIMILDTETCNIEQTDTVKRGNNLTYNIGFSIMTPCNGEVLTTRSYIIDEIFFGERDRMASCYYAEKIPQYIDGLWTGDYEVASFYTVLMEIEAMCKEFDITAICAHNAAFDIDALNTTLAYLTGYRLQALPHNVEIWDSMKMANSVFGKRPSYRKYCEKNGFMTKHATPRPRLTAEILYRFISNDIDFVEEHTALADVMIEIEIVLACYRSHQKFERVLYEAR